MQIVGSALAGSPSTSLEPQSQAMPFRRGALEQYGDKCDMVKPVSSRREMVESVAGTASVVPKDGREMTEME